MTRGMNVWWVVAIVLSLINLVAEVFAAARLEVLHACIHGVLLLVGVYFVWRLGPWRTASA